MPQKFVFGRSAKLLPASQRNLLPAAVKKLLSRESKRRTRIFRSQSHLFSGMRILETEIAQLDSRMFALIRG